MNIEKIILEWSQDKAQYILILHMYHLTTIGDRI